MADGRRAPGHIAGLDGLRGIAALVVVVLHGCLTFDGTYVPPAACLAVDFFFLLSGYVIAHAYDAPMRAGMTFGGFMARRVIRLYPMLWFGTFLSSVLFLAAQCRSPTYDPASMAWLVAGSFLLLPVGFAIGDIAYPLNVALWSLFFEFAASASYASRLRTLSRARLGALVLAFAAASVVMTLRSSPYIQIGFGSPDKFLLGFVRVAFPFWAGVLLFRWSGAFRVPCLPVGVVGAALAVLLLLPLESPIYKLALTLVAFPALIVLAVHARSGPASLWACLVLGRLSFPIYALHWPVYRLSISLRGDGGPIAYPAWARIVAGAVLSVAIAHSVTMAYDEPVRRYLSGWLGRRANTARARPTARS